MKKYVLAAVVVVVTASCLFANDIVPPPWRTNPTGTPPTTYQRWEFDTSANPAIAEEVHNDFGSPVLMLTCASWFPTYSGASGVWRMNAMGTVNITIPNTSNVAPDSWKEVWLQISYLDPGGYGADVPIITSPEYDSLDLVERQTLSNGYIHDVYSIIIRPNPPVETLDIFSIQCAIYIDEIVVDTICVPEPATIALLCLGGLLLRKK